MTVAVKVKQTLACLKGVHSTLGIYAVQTENDEIKTVFKEAMIDVKEVIADLEKRTQKLEYEEPQFKGF